ncbi:glycosyltransferase family 4 protein [Sphingomonas sp. NSE70-1]|uniref:Glycosyltransferase family 4 protein n=1 Tax=Sphingomonas caseinilyticus TaxID=2908205 RepID=A0ABT0RR63_9SPHN|nr:glycosyltransferase family 1 protein [Sphingomonas caseinilyticus]MCL6697313.1 glycosyltransferase family 4 protein [Sphingomonas caseinilyticus]
MIWRLWAGKLATGIDRVSLAYVEHFKHRARAVVQRKSLRITLSARDSDRLFEQILHAGHVTRVDWIIRGLSLLPSAIQSSPERGAIYLNVGHTGLNEPSLPEWVSANQLRAVYMIHDIIPVTHPQFCRPGEASKHEQRLDHMLASASGIIANSESTLAALEQYAQSHGRPMPPSIAALIAGQQAAKDRPPASPGRPYFLVVGTIEARKNHILLLRLWQRLVDQLGDAAPMLVIIGQRGWEAEATFGILDDLGGLAKHVVEFGRCGDEQLAGWISGARALLMPSFIEGFGLPVIEALQLGCPVIASDLPVYREIAGSIPTYVDPRDETGWLELIRAFVTDSPERQRQMAAMPDYRAPSWSEHFGKVEPWLDRVI